MNACTEHAYTPVVVSRTNTREGAGTAKDVSTETVVYDMVCSKCAIVAAKS